MTTKTEHMTMDTTAGVQVIDITSEVRKLLTKSDLQEGLAIVFVPGSTATVTTIEYEPGLVADMTKALDRIAPRNGHYEHDQRWHDGNGHSHVRAAFLKPSVTIPFLNNTLMLGTWQQLVFIELDVRPRNRTIIVQFIGD
jgi:secondary thiamine-phosphate synthase enzyme